MSVRKSTIRKLFRSRLSKNKYLKELPKNAQKWIRIREILRVSLFITFIIISTVIYIINEISIMMVYNGITFPIENRSFSLDLEEPNNSSLNIPYLFKNDGFYDLSDVEVDIFLRFEYYLKDQDSTKNIIVFSKEFKLGKIRTGSYLNGSLYGDFNNFHWNNIYQMSGEYDELKPIKIYFDIFLGFTIIGVETDQISIVNVFGGNETQSSASTTTTENIMYPYSNDFHTGNENLTIKRFNASQSIFIVIASILCSALIFAFLKKINKSQDSVRRRRKALKKKRRNRSNLRTIITISVYIAIVVVLIYNSLSNISLFSGQYEDLGKEYIKRHETITYISIITLALVSIVRLVPMIKKDTFHKDSIHRSFISVIISVIFLITMIFWAINSVIVYEMDKNVIIVRNTLAMYIPLMSLYTVNVIINIINTVHFRVYKAHYRRIQNKEKREKKFIIPKSKEAFRLHVFKAIRKLTSKNNRPPSLSQIRSYFERKGISKVSKSNKLNTLYMDTLVEYQYLQRSETTSGNTSYYIYQLTPKAEKYFETDDKQSYELHTTSGINEKEVSFDGEQLIICPNCGYYCRQEWKECPICNTTLFIPSHKELVKEEIDEEIQNVYCISCRRKLLNELSDKYLCDICDNRIRIRKKTLFCSSCGSRSIEGLKFCTKCNRAFYLSSYSMFKKYTNDNLRAEILKCTRNSKMIIIGFVQAFLLAFYVTEIIKNIFQIPVIMNIYDLSYLLIFFTILLSVNRIKYYYLKKERIKRDDRYRILLTSIYTKKDEIDQISVRAFNLYKNFFKYEEKNVQMLLQKINKFERVRKFIYVVIVIIAFVSIYTLVVVSNIMVTLLLWLSVTVLFYYIFSGKKTRYINNMFRLGDNYSNDDYQEYVKYIIKQLDYI